MKKVMAVLAVVSAGLMLVVATVQADTKLENFEGFALGSPNGQFGWVGPTGPAAPLGPDVAIVTPGISGDRALRISNAYEDGAFDNWVFSQHVDPAGETAGLSHLEVNLDVKSFTPETLQPDLQISLAPQSGGGNRMSFLRFEDRVSGIHVFFVDATGTVSPIDFNTTDIATLSRTSAHHVTIVMDFVAGPSNDVVKVYIDGSLRITGTSWENYYRFDAEQAGNNNKLPVVDSLIFQARGDTPALDTQGEGFLVDNVGLASSVPVVPTPTPTTTTTTTTTAPPPTTGPCTITGTAGADALVGTTGSDVICAKAGDDVVRGLAGADILKGGPGNDLLRGGPGDDLLNGGRGYDTCRGGKGTDTVRKCEA